MHGNVPVRFGRGWLDFLVPKEPAAYLIAESHQRARLQPQSVRRPDAIFIIPGVA